MWGRLRLSSEAQRALSARFHDSLVDKNALGIAVEKRRFSAAGRDLRHRACHKRKHDQYDNDFDDSHKDRNQPLAKCQVLIAKRRLSTAADFRWKV